MDTNNPLSNISYTNKDFQTIYPELIELVKKLTQKWDPSITNESDPGLILLKVNALMADKNNYNIDKNVLECFPLSVTQDKNAYQLFEQLGCRMKWYRAAGSKYILVDNTDPNAISNSSLSFDNYPIITIKWVGEKVQSDETYYIIPQFSMVCDEESKIVYTLLKEVTVSDLQEAEEQKVPALQGIVSDLKINNDDRIRFSNLDENRRIYFDDYNIAENGVFVSQYGSGDWLSWHRVDNIQTQPISDRDRYYKFGLSQNLDRCYIEFPENASTLIGEGIQVKYIKTSGVDGNIPARTIVQGYQIGKIYDRNNIEDETLAVDFNGNVSVTNVSEITNGQNPESIDEAYLNYTRTVGTFDTLVTLRDYINAILTSNEVSNGFVTDRTCDPQTTYKVMTKNNDIDVLSTVVISDLSGLSAFNARSAYSIDDKVSYNSNAYLCVATVTAPDVGDPDNPNPDADTAHWQITKSTVMSAFDLKFYLLRYLDVTNNKTSYDYTFQMIYDETVLDDVENYIESKKCIQHDYKYISDTTQQKGPCYFINTFPINCKIIPQYQLTKLQSEDIRNNVTKAVLNAFNAKHVVFGEETSYEKLYDTILNADKRIKSIYLDELKYTTYRYELSSGQGGSSWIKEQVSITDAEYESGTLSLEPSTKSHQIDIIAKSALAGVTQLLKKDTNFEYTVDQSSASSYNEISAITTHADGNCTGPVDDYYSYTIKENETVQAYRQNYLPKQVYSSYVRYWISNVNTETTINPNQIYKLGENESITFAWKKEDSDVDYATKTYNNQEYIKPDFTLIFKNTAAVAPATTPVLEDKSTWPSLSPNKSISIVEKAEQTLDSNSYCYWITNDIEKDSNGEPKSYILFKEGESTKVLEENEYFVYTNSTLSAELAIFGSGTEINRTGTNGVVRCPYGVKEEELVEKGVSALEDVWVINSNIHINTIKDMDIISVGQNSTVKFTVSSGTPVLGNEPISVTSLVIDNDAVGMSALNDPDNPWKIRCLLSLDTTSGKSQELLSNQSIVLFDENGEEINTLSGPETFVETSLPISTIGGENINLTWIDNNGEIQYVDFYSYQLQDPSSTDPQNPITYKKLSDGTYEVALSDEGGTIAFSGLGLEQANYILSISQPNSGVSGIIVSVGGTPLSPINNRTVTDVGYFYYNVMSAISSISVSISGSNLQGKTIYIKPLYRYTLPTIATANSNNILNALIALDIDKNFDYTYVVDDSIRIDNPLLAESFFNVNHIYNKNTIAKIGDMSWNITNIKK